LVFIDESGFLLIPNVKRTWAPRGQTPTVRYNFKHQKVSAISALAVSPQRRRIALYLQFRRRSFKGPDVRCFLQSLLRHIAGPLLVLWDGATIHRDRRVQAFIDAQPRLWLEEFPGYAPELNPAEFVWCQTDADLANSLLLDQNHLLARLSAKRRKLRRSQRLLWACIYASDLPWP
jgi:transposase